jgi:hypothetical protein
MRNSPSLDSRGMGYDVCVCVCVCVGVDGVLEKFPTLDPLGVCVCERECIYTLLI